MPTEKPKKDSVIFWQKVNGEGMGTPEPAILVSPYSDVITLHQEKNYININYDSLSELIKLLNTMKRTRDSA